MTNRPNAALHILDHKIMNMQFLLLFLTVFSFSSCGPQEIIEDQSSIIEKTESRVDIFFKQDARCHSLRQNTDIIDGKKVIAGIDQKITTYRCFLVDENKEKIVLIKNGQSIFEKKVAEIRVSTRLYATICNQVVILAWGGGDSDSQGNLYDYEIYSLTDYSFIRSGKSPRHPTINFDCQVSPSEAP